MWNKVTQAVGFTSDVSESKEEEEEEKSSVNEVQEQIDQQNLVIDELKALLRKSEDQLKERDKQLSELSSKFQRFQIQSKAKVANLTNQLREKTPKRDEGDFDDTSSSDSSDYSTRGKVILLRKQLETAKQQLEKKEKENQDIVRKFELRIKELEIQLQEKQDIASSSVSVLPPKVISQESVDNNDLSQGSAVQEMYAQMVYKDSKILDLNNHIMELERKILDLQEHIKEKDEVLQSRNLAIQLMSADMSRKGKSVVDELEETRGQMKLMQSNFSDIEHKWKEESETLNSEIADMKETFKQQISHKDALINSLEESLKKVEGARYDLATRNAELQKKVVLVEERSDKHCEAYRKKIDEELHSVQESLKNEKSRSTELQKALEEATNQSESKVLKARVKERTKLKALERELAALKNLQLQEKKPEEVTQLQQQVAILEEEKGTLQLRLIEVDEQITMQENLKAENAELHGFIKEIEEKARHFEDRARILENENNELEAKVKKQEENCNHLQNRYEEVSEQNSSLMGDLHGLSLMKADLENHINRLEETVMELTTKNKELSDELVFHKEEKVSLDMKIIELEEIHESDEKQKSHLVQKLKELEDSSSSSSPEYLMQEEKQDLETRCAELNLLLNSATDCKKDLEKKVESVNAELIRIKNSLTEAEKKNTEWRDRIYELELKLEESKALCHENEQQLKDASEIRNSLSTVMSVIHLQSISDFPEFWKGHLEELEQYKQKYEIASKLKNEMESVIENKSQKINDYISQNQLLEEQIKTQLHSFDEEKASLLHSLKEQAEKIMALQAATLEKDDLILQLKDAIQKNEKDMKALNEAVQNHLQHVRLIEEEKNMAKQEICALTEKLSTENSKTQSKMSSLLEQISDLESEVSRLKSEVLEKGEIENSLKKELSSIKIELENCIQTHNQKELFYQNTCEEKDHMLVSLQEKISTITQNFHEDIFNMEKLQKESLNKYEKELEVTVSNLKKRIDDLERQKREIEQENDTLKQEVSERKKSVEQMNTSVQELQLQINKVNEELIDEKRKAQNVTSQTYGELNTAHHQISTLQEKVSSLQSYSEERENVNKSLVEEKVQLELEARKLRQNQQSLESSLHEVLEERDILRTQFAALSDQNKKLICVEETMHDLLIENESLKKQCEDLNCDLVNREAKLEDLLQSRQTTIQEQKTEISILQSKLKMLQDSLDSKEEDYLHVTSQLKMVCNENESYQNENKSLQYTIQEKDNELEKYVSVTDSLRSEIKEKDNELEKHISLVDSLRDEIQLLKETSKSTRDFDNLVVEMSNTNKQLESSVGLLKQQIESLASEKEELMNENNFLKTVIQKCEQIVIHLSIYNESDTLEDVLQKQTEMYMQLEKFKDECCKLIELIPLVDNKSVPLEIMNNESILQYVGNATLSIDHLKTQLGNFVRDNAQLQLKIQQLQECNNRLSSEYSVVKEQYNNLQKICEDLKEQHKLSVLDLNCIANKVSCIEETNLQRFEVMISRIETVCHVIRKLSLFKEQIHHLYMTNEDHERVLQDKMKGYQNEFESLKQGILEEQNTLSETICAIKEEVQEKKHQLEAADEQIQLKSKLLVSLESEVKKLKEYNDHLNVEMNQNQNNYNNNLKNLKIKLLTTSTSVSSLKDEVSDMRKFQGQLYQEQQQAVLNSILSVKNLQIKIGVLHSNFLKISEENLSLKKSLFDTANHFHELEQQNADQVSHLQAELDKFRYSSVNEIQEKNKLIEEQRSQVITLSDDLESLKLGMEKCVNEKDAIAKELEYFKTAEKDLTTLSLKYDAAKNVIQIMFRALKDKPEVENIDGAFEAASREANILDENFLTLVNQLQNEIIQILKANKQLSNEVAHLHNEVRLLNSEITENNEMLHNVNLKNEELNLEVLSLKDHLKSSEDKLLRSNQSNTSRSVEIDDSSTVECTTVTPLPLTEPVRTDVALQQSSAAHVSATEIDNITENEKLRQELSANKTKSDKMLVKLKLFKNKIDKLNKDVQELTSTNQKLYAESSELEQKLMDAEMKYEQLNNDFCICNQDKESEISHLKCEVQRISEQNSLLHSDYDSLQVKFQELKCVCDQQKVEIQQYREYQHYIDHKLEGTESSYHDLENKLDMALSEKIQLEKKLENLQEHTNMIMSDNDTYQAVVEKLNHSNSILKNDLRKLNETYAVDIEQLKTRYELELKEQQSLLNERLDQNKSLNSELQRKCEELQVTNDELFQKLEKSLQNCKTLGEENAYLTKKLELTKHDMTVCMVDNSTQYCDVSSVAVESVKLQEESYIKLENDLEKYKLQIDLLNHDLLAAKTTIQQLSDTENHWKSEYTRMELYYQQVISEFQEKISAVQKSPLENVSKDADDVNHQLEMELQQALSSLHKQSVRSEELGLEVSKLSEEKNSLKQKLNQYQQQFEQQYHQLQFEQLECKKEESAMQRNPAPCDMVMIELSPKESECHNLQLNYPQHEIAALHQRLLETQKTCEELRKANEALDNSLMLEREQRQMAEEELGYAQKQLLPLECREPSSKDEYQMLLEGFDEPEMLVEKNFSITRKVKSHAHKLRRWLRGRRMYLHRTCQRKKYSEILLIFYMCAIHFWLLLCIVKHS